MSVLKFKVDNEEVAVDIVKGGTSVADYIKDKIASSSTAASGRVEEDAFYAVDIGRLIKLYDHWKSTLPTVHPFYAVKCNDSPVILKLLVALGAGFDCASQNEIETVLNLGAVPDRIIYANPCKQISHLLYAAGKGVEMMTFDSEGEIEKVKEHFPKARMVLRIRADDPDANCPLGAKFGCSTAEGKLLLNVAKSCGLNVIGISFHVGSGCQNAETYGTALSMSAELFQYGKDIGYSFTLLDIGGGFPGTKDSNHLFSKVTESINQFLASLFNKEAYPGLTVIAEPGRYFATSLYAVAVNVLNKKQLTSASERKSFMYYVNDGIYGTFNFMAFNDYYTVTPLLLKESPSLPTYQSTLWGPTCDSVDKLCVTELPELDQGDWIYFDDIGAYSLAARTTFNGFKTLKSFYYISEELVDKLLDILKQP